MAIQIPILGSLIKDGAGAVKDLLGTIIGDKTERDAAEAKVDLIFAGVLSDAEETMRVGLEAQREVLLAEISGASWMQRNWRPILMLTFTAIIGHNYIVVPYWADAVVLDFPDKFWNLLTIGVGGYVVSRSVFDKGGLEKVMKAYKGD